VLFRSRILGYTGKDVQKLPQTDGKAQLTMDNHFGSPVLESFFLVTPLNLAIALATAEPVSKQNIGAYTVYLWQERVPADTTHRVDVVLERSQPTTLVLRERHFVKLVLGKERMTFQGNDVTWEGLPGLLEEVPNRSETVLEVALADEAVPGKLLMDALNLATKYGFEYGSYVGQAQLGAKGEASVTVETLGASPQETPEATEAVKAAEQLKSVAQAFLQAVAAGEDETAAGLCAPGTVKTSEFAKLREYYDLSQARIVQANDRQGNAYAVTNFFPSKEGKKATAMGIGMRKQGDRWLIRDIDALPDEPSLAAYIESFNKAFPPAEPVARAWVGMIDAGQYDTAWDEAAEMLRNAIPKATFVEQTKAVRAPLGKVESRSTRSVSYTNSLPGAPDGQYAVIQFQTSFENKKQAVETVTPMKGEDGKWRVSGYYIK
jgi:hypothetical protein